MRRRFRARNFNFLRNILISVAVLLAIFVSAGVAYTWYMGQDGNVDPAAIADPVKTRTTNVIKHTKSAPGAKVGASVHMITSPVKPGMNASITVRTNSDATCTIKVVYDKIASTDSGLGPKVADEYGMVSWTWTVEASVPIGKWPATVTCAIGEQSGVTIGDLVVAN